MGCILEVLRGTMQFLGNGTGNVGWEKGLLVS